MPVRTLTVLFTDLVGSTELLQTFDDHAAHRLEVTHLRGLRDAVEHHRGVLVKTLGDGVMATFAAARDALEAAVSIQQATAGSLAAGPRLRLVVRVGISSGDVCLRDGDCYGTAVIEASRLCARAADGQVLLAESTRVLARPEVPLRDVGVLALKGLTESTHAWEAIWSPLTPRRPRALLADDAVLVREGVARVLEEHGIDVLAQAGDAEALLRLTSELRPDLAIVDLRMPPTHTAEGLNAAERILAAYPRTGVLLLSQDLQPHYARQLMGMRPAGVGYLLKERVADVGQFVEAAKRVAAGGQAFEPTLLADRGNVPAP
jgi:class 3 adenylate cyclase/CheY-like chemotaxis protein